MAKAMLIMDMPNNCSECQLFYNTAGTKMCEGIGRLVECEKEKQTWCPLREVPQKKDTKYNPARNPYITQGYNACIDEILGGGE